MRHYITPSVETVSLNLHNTLYIQKAGALDSHQDRLPLCVHGSWNVFVVILINISRALAVRRTRRIGDICLIHTIINYVSEADQQKLGLYRSQAVSSTTAATSVRVVANPTASTIASLSSAPKWPSSRLRGGQADLRNGAGCRPP